MRFADIAGRDSVKRLLAEQVDNGRLPHALLLWGSEGAGQLSFARALAQYIHCPNRKKGDSCGVCPVCRQHTALNYPDLIFSFPIPAAKSGHKSICEDYAEPWREFLQKYPLAQWRQWLELCGAENSQPQIRVDESAEIIRNLSMGNYGNNIKIMVLWLPEKLHSSAANKLLKLVEEPHQDRMFIMVSDSPSHILPTIYSRLQRVKIPLPNPEVTSEWLQRNHNISPTDATEAAQAAQGNQLLALRMLDDSGEEGEFRTLFQEVMRKAWQRDVKALRIWSENVAGLKREKIKRFMQYFVHQIRLNYLYDLQSRELTPMMHADSIFSQRFSPFIHGGNVEEIMQQCNNVANDIAGNANARIVMFDFTLHLIMQIKIKP